MTREDRKLKNCPFCGGEVIITGNKFKWVCCKNCAIETTLEGWTPFVEALKGETGMTREDLIKWQKAFAKTYAKYPPEAQQAINETIKILQEPERKMGRWEQFGEKLPYRLKCSECDWDVPQYGKFYSFCPNCGADMVGEGND